MAKKRFKSGDTYVSGSSTTKKAAAPSAPEVASTDDFLGSLDLLNLGGLNKSLANLSPGDKQALHQNVLSTYAPGQLDAIKARDAEQAAANATNKRFGHDMAWLDPEFQQNAYTLGESERSQVFADPELVADQTRALDSLWGIAEDGGATAQERARRAGARADSEGWLRGQREADMQNLSERGMSGSGAELLALATDRQAAAQRNSAADIETDAWLEQRALDATMGAGNLAGEMRDTGFREGQTRAGAADEFAKLNASTINSAEAANKNFKREAWQRTLDTRTAIEQKNIDRGIGIAGGLLSGDRAENQAGYAYAGASAKGDADTYNGARDSFTGAIMTPNTAKTNAQNQQDFYEGKLTGDSGKAGEDFIKTIASFGGGGGGSSGGGGFGGGNFGGIASGISSAKEDDEDGQYA